MCDTDFYDVLKLMQNRQVHIINLLAILRTTEMVHDLMVHCLIFRFKQVREFKETAQKIQQSLFGKKSEEVSK